MSRSRENRITRADVLAVKEKAEMFPTMTIADIGKLCDVSNATASRILRGEYDHLLDDAPAVDSAVSAQMLDELKTSIGAVAEYVRSVDSTIDAYGDGIISALSAIETSLVSELRALRKLQAFAVECKLYEMDPRTNYKPEDIDTMREKLEGLR